jgi:hypothetical protein
MAGATAHGQMFAQRFGATAWTPARLSPVRWYALDESLSDRTGNAGDGAALTAPTYGTGIVGQAFFPGATNGVTLADAYAIGSGNVSVAAWFRRDRVGTSIDSILGRETSTSLPGLWVHTRVVSGVNVIRIVVNTTASSVIIVEASNAWTQNNWAHFAATLDRSGNCIIYINGTASATSDISAHSGGDMQDIPYIAMRDGSALSSLLGAIDDVLVFDRVLSPAEVKTIYDESAKQSAKGPWK